ncbi:MAG: elongation factor G [Gemmatimonadota bacterium]
MGTAREYTTDQIRNVAVLGHGGSGKTTLIDALCFTAGTARRRGNVDDGHALTLTTPEEADHKISMQLTPAYAEWMDAKINLLDTPGYLDFTGDAVAAVRVADAAVIVVSAVGGVEVGTEKVWEYCEARGLPRMFFVSMLDKEHADFNAVYREIKERLSPKALPVEIPIGSGDGFRGIINLFSERAHIYQPGTQTGEYDEADIPDELKAQFDPWEQELQETIATSDETLLERYLEGETISRDEAIEAMARAVARGDVIPVFCGSARLSYGMRALLRKIVELFPHPGEIGPVRARDGEREMELFPNGDSPFSALVFKTSAEPHVGELSYFRLYSGTAVSGMEAYNPGRGGSEKLNHLSVPLGKERIEVQRLHAGDIGVMAKFKDTHTNDTLTAPGREVQLEAIAFPRPDIAVALKGVTRGDEDKLGEVLHKLSEEDPTLTSEFNAELHQTIARGLGELHLDVHIERMKRKYGVSVVTEQPRIAYRETITRQAEGQGRFKKQSGGRGQFGDCWIRLRPIGPGEGYSFQDSIKGGVIPGKYLPSIDRGIQEAASKGILAGYPVVDFAAECYDGSYHTVDSSDIAFKVAGSMAFQAVAEKAGPVLLEPVMEVKVTTPDEYVGDIMGDLTGRRGKVQGMDPDGGRTVITARVPEAELYKYAATLRSMTQGRAHHSRRFAAYEQVPHTEAEKIIAARKAEKDA